MKYNNIVGIASRDRSYVLTPQQLSPYVTKEELQDAKKELEEIRKKRTELLEEIEQEKKNRDEPISADDLQSMMFPVENINRRIEELRNLICTAQIVEKSARVPEEEIEEVLFAYTEGSNRASDIEANSAKIANIPVENLFFIKGDEKIDAIPGDYSPFYAILDEEHIGYNRMLLKGWELVDNTGKHFTDIREIWDICNAIKNRNSSNRIEIIKSKYPNAYSPWSTEENAELLELYSNQGKTLAEISEILRRTKNGISIQLKKLLGIDKLPIRQKQTNPEEYSTKPISIKSINPSEIADDKMPEYLSLIKQFEEWFKQVKQYAINQAIENGIYYEGYEIKTTFKNTFKDQQMIMDTIRTKYPAQYNKCIRLETVDKIKKALGEKNYKSSIEEFVEQTELHSLVKSK